MKPGNVRLITHAEGNGRLFADSQTPLQVRYALDTWQETIPTGSGTSAQMERRDGFLWSVPGGLEAAHGTLEVESGHKFRVSLFDVLPNRARFYCSQ